MRYRRSFIPGGSFFFTVVTEQRRPILASAEAVLKVRSQRPFTLDAMVVLPDHLHCIWAMPPDDADFATRWRLIKTRFTKDCDPVLRGVANASQTRRREQAMAPAMEATRKRAMAGNPRIA